MAEQASSAGLLPNEFFFEPVKVARDGGGMDDSAVLTWYTETGSNVAFRKSEGNKGLSLLLFGELYDSQNPRRTTREILDNLAESGDLETLPLQTRALTGEFVMAAALGGGFTVFADACAQMELFYDFRNPSRFASSPLLLPGHSSGRRARNESNPLCDLPEGAPFCKLPANFRFSSTTRGTVRYFPTPGCMVKRVDIDEAVEWLSSYLTGIFSALQNKGKLAVPITAGYDSRMLTAACKASGATGVFYHLYRHGKVDERHHDILIGAKLAAAIGVERKILEYSKEMQPADENMYAHLYRPRPENAARLMNGDKKHFRNRMVINGNLGEIGRSYFGNLKSVTPEILVKLRNKKGDPTEIEKMRAWLDSFNSSHLGAENILDLFYWEDRMANWASRAKTEYRLVTSVISPLNCHEALTLILGVPKKYRTYFRNRLFERVIHRLEPHLSPFPYNPELKSTIIKTLIAAGVYGTYKNFQIKHL